jgi:hypothetical protein
MCICGEPFTIEHLSADDPFPMSSISKSQTTEELYSRWYPKGTNNP